VILESLLRPRRERRYRANLADARAAFDEAGLTFFLNCGTLLGAVRDGRPCHGDLQDIDLSVFNHELTVRRREALLRAFERRGFAGHTDGRVDTRQMYFKRGGNHIDVFGYARHGDYYFRYWSVFGDVPMIVPARYLDRLEIIAYCGQDIRVPSDTANFLTLSMGRDWRQPRSRRSYRGLNELRLTEHRARYDDFLAGRFDEWAYLERGFGWERLAARRQADEHGG
jgi:hypothetical protein